VQQDTIEIRFPNWEKFNPRSDRANFTWLRLENNFFHDQAIFALSEHQKLLFIFLLCEASKKNCGDVSVNVQYVSALLKRSVDQIIQDTAALATAELLTLGGKTPASRRHRAGTKTRQLRPTIRTNDTNERDDTDDTSTPPDGELMLVSRSSPLVQIWNQESGPELPKVRECSPKSKREKAANARWQERPNPDEWKEAIRKINSNPFLRGENDTGWKASFDWLLKPGNFTKVIEGVYDRGAGRPAKGVRSKTEHERSDDLDAQFNLSPGRAS
jgi:hypothetical protein